MQLHLDATSTPRLNHFAGRERRDDLSVRLADLMR